MVDKNLNLKLCIGNLSDQWTITEAEKTELYGNIYDFVVDYETIVGVGPVYDMHRYLMTKYNVLPYHKMSEYFPPYNNSINKIKVELDLNNYATKDDIKNITHVDVSSFASKTNLAALKTEGNLISSWKSTGINNYSTNSNMDAGTGGINSPNLEDNGRMSVKFDGIYLKQNKLVKPNNNNVINVYIVYKLDTISSTRDDTFTIQNALFGGIKLTKNKDASKYKYEGYGICFDGTTTFTDGNITNGRNALIFGVHENSLVHSSNKANNIYVIGSGFVLDKNDTSLSAEKKYVTNFSAVNKKCVLSLHYNGDNSYLFVNGKQELKFKAKDDQILKKNLCLGNFSDDWTVNNTANTSLYGNVYDFAVDYTETSVDNIYNIHQYLIKKNLSL